MEKEHEAIKKHYIILNDGLNLATTSKERALERLKELLTLIELKSNASWKIELSYGA